MTNKRKKSVRELASTLGINRRAAASRLDARASSGKAKAPGRPTEAYAGPRGDAAPGVSLRELWACASAGVVRCDGDSGGWSLVEPPPEGAPADLIDRCRSAAYLDAMEKNNWATEARHALGQIGRDIATAYAESVRKGKPALGPSTAPTPPAIPQPGKPVRAIDVFTTDPGWRSIMFAMNQPVAFQYRIETGDRRFTARATGLRSEADGTTTEVRLEFSGHLDGRGALWTSAIEETWSRQ
jgi:hypothetical protein